MFECIKFFRICLVVSDNTFFCFSDIDMFCFLYFETLKIVFRMECLDLGKSILVVRSNSTLLDRKRGGMSREMVGIFLIFFHGRSQ